MTDFRTRKDGRVFPVKGGSGKNLAVQPVVFARHPENLSSVQIKRLSVSRFPQQPNPVATRELELYSTNQADLYKQQFIPIVKNLERKREKGTYDRDKARLLWLNYVNSAAKKYEKDFGSRGQVSSFSKADRLAVAGTLERDYRAESDLGNYKGIK